MLFHPSFLAPPPASEHASPAEVSSDLEVFDFAGIAGISSDFAEIRKMASNFLQLGSEQEDYDSAGGAVGVTEEVVAFVVNSSIQFYGNCGCALSLLVKCLMEIL
uniref:Uncharacterized protein n=1 Tax=Davidia involucrata TaxID=16924 RepID=A0A5B6YHD1_DAVIN